MPVLVDSNVLVYAWDQGSHFHPWALSAIGALGENEVLAVNPIIFAELCLAVESEAELELRLRQACFEKCDLPWRCLGRAARAFERHIRARRGAARGKPAKTPLPDFFIGAHAETEGHAILTVDAARYITYFPTVRVIAPPR